MLGPEPGALLTVKRTGVHCGDDLLIQMTSLEATARGVVVDGQGRPQADVYLAVLGEGGAHCGPMITDASGTFALAVPGDRKVELGLWRTRAFGPDEVDVTGFEHRAARRVIGFDGPPAARVEVDGEVAGLAVRLR